MSHESIPEPATPTTALAEPAMSEFRLTRVAKMTAVAVTVLGVGVTLYFDLLKLPGYAITFVTATLAGALAQKLSRK